MLACLLSENCPNTSYGTGVRRGSFSTGQQAGVAAVTMSTWDGYIEHLMVGAGGRLPLPACHCICMHTHPCITPFLFLAGRYHLGTSPALCAAHAAEHAQTLHTQHIQHCSCVPCLGCASLCALLAAPGGPAQWRQDQVSSHRGPRWWCVGPECRLPSHHTRAGAVPHQQWQLQSLRWVTALGNCSWWLP